MHFELGCGVLFFFKKETSKRLRVCEPNMLKETKAVFSWWSNWHFIRAREWGLGQRQANSFSKGQGGWLLVMRCCKISQGWSRPQSRDPLGTQIIPLIQNWHPGPWVNVVVLMQMEMIIASSYEGSAVAEPGGTGVAGSESPEFLLRKAHTGILCKGIKWNGHASILWAEIRWFL